MTKIELSTSDNSSFLKMPRRTLTGDAKWKDIEDLINRWARRNKYGAWWLEQVIKSTKEGLLDQTHGAMKNEGMAGSRLGITLHPELLQYIQAFYPDFLQTKDELHEFMKRFPKFSMREKV